MKSLMESQNCEKTNPIVLLLDEDCTATQRLCAALEQMGMTTLPIHQDDKALAIVARIQPDLVLLDIGPGRPDAIALCRFITENEITSGTPVFVLGDSNEMSIRLEAYLAGACRYLLKKKNPAHLARTVNNFFWPLCEILPVL